MNQAHGIDSSKRIPCPDGFDKNLWEDLCLFQRYTIESEKEHFENLLSHWPTLSDQFRYETICEFLRLSDLQ